MMDQSHPQKEQAIVTKSLPGNVGTRVFMVRKTATA